MKKNNCFHCGLPILDKNEYSIIINEILYHMCCLGCLAVFKFILNNGFFDYYKHRTIPGITIDDFFLKDQCLLDIYDNEKVQTKFIKTIENNLSYIILAIEGITCAACTWLIERHIKRVKGVHKVFVNLATCRAQITWNINELSLNNLLNEFKLIGYKVFPYIPKKQEEFSRLEYKKELKKLIVAGISMAQVMMLSVALYIGEAKDMNNTYWFFIRFMCFFLSFPTLFFSAKGIFYNALRSIKNKNFGMDITISLSLLIAFVASIKNLLQGIGDIYFDSICMFIFFLLIGRFLEMRARHHSGEIIYSLQILSTGVATVITKDTRVKKLIPIENIELDDFIFIKNNETIPMDGIITCGSSSINESMLTGEPIPVYKKVGDYVIGGSINIENDITIKATKTKNTSIISIIIQLLEQAGSIKPKINVLINIIAGYFVLTVLVLTFITTLIWIKLGNENILNIILSMLVVTCPCALSLATPVAMTSATNALAKIGFLIAKEHTLEKLSTITDVIFDKTGTLTVNNFFIKKIKLNTNKSIKYIFSLAYSLEKKSKHPIANAFINSKIPCNNFVLQSNIVNNYINQGIEGIINNVTYRLGKTSFIKNWTKNFIKINKNLDDGIWITLANKKKILAWFNLTNPLRNESIECINQLQKLNINIHILSGDPSKNIDYIADILKVKNRKKNSSVIDKLNYITNLKKNGAITMMIGDGVNDAPALNNSHISTAMGSGADLTKINSDSILLNNNLITISKSIIHGKKNRLVIKQNIIWAIFYNIIGLILAAFGLITPYYASIGMSGSSLIVILNSLRLGKI